MSAKLFFSNSPLVLLEKLSQNLEWSDPFKAPHIATSTQAMKRWVQMRLSEKRGILANMDFMPLERMLWQRLEKLDLDHEVEFRKPARLLDEQGLKLLILGFLKQSPPEEVKQYLETDHPEGLREKLHAHRLCQLSKKLAEFFREYEYSRVREQGHEGLACLWKHGKDCFQSYVDKKGSSSLRQQVASLEHWQKKIYHELFQTGGLRDALGENLQQYSYTLPQYAEMVLSQHRKNAEAGRIAPSYHLFGLSQISPFHRSLIQRLADAESLRGRQAQFFIYSLNPCAEYWEDLLTPGERHRQQASFFPSGKFRDWRQLDNDEKAKLRLSDEKIQEDELHLEENENSLLSRWGKPGRENIQLWCQITQYDFFECFRAAPTPSLLSTIQNSILHRRGTLPKKDRIPQDSSLQILVCPEIHREVETVYHGIVEALLRDPALRPDDIAVLVPNMEKYRHILTAVFGRIAPGDPGHIPFNLSDASASSESDYARAVRQIFELAEGRFSRKEIFDLIANPSFQSGLGVDGDTLQVWSDWTAKLNIFHGFDGEDKQTRGYAPDTLHTWMHGLERLILGTVMETPVEDDDRHFSDIVPYSDGLTPDRALLQAFLNLIQGLFHDLETLRDKKHQSWSVWIDRCEAIFDRYLETPEEQPLEGFIRADLRKYLTELRTMDALEALASTNEFKTTGVTSTVPMDLILSRLEGLKAGKESHLSGGVNVASLSALRSLPFKWVYVVGLGEGEFPEEDNSSTLDLRRYRRVIGDVEPSERNRYLFLETLLCTTERLRLSYVSRDIQQGKTFQMSSVLNELVDYIEECILLNPSDDKSPKFQTTQVPLLTRDPSLFKKTPPTPWDPPPNPFRDDKLMAWLEAKRKSHPNFSDLIRSKSKTYPYQELFPLPLPTPRTLPPNPVVKVTLEDMRLFLENPAQYALRKRLGIRDNVEEDPMDQEDEPFYCPYPSDFDLLQKVIHRRIALGSSMTREKCHSYFLDLYQNLALRGQMPEGHFRSMDQEQLWERAEAMLDGLDLYFTAMQESGREQECIPGLLLGEGSGRGLVHRMRDLPVKRFPALKIQVANLDVELHGELPCLFHDLENGYCHTLVFMAGEFSPRRLLSAFIFYVAGVASETKLGNLLSAAPFKIHHVHKKKSGFEMGNWGPFQLTRDAAKAWLQNLATEMLHGKDFDLLPFDLIAKELAPERRLKSNVDYTETLRLALEFQEENPEWNAPKLPNSQVLLNPQVPGDAEEKIRRRLSVFFNFIPDPNHEP